VKSITVRCVELAPIPRYVVSWSDSTAGGRRVATGGEASIRMLLREQGLDDAEIELSLTHARQRAEPPAPDVAQE
jgi:hypothetical protein